MEHHVLNLEREFVEYYLTDMKKSLKDQEVRVSLRWESMATVGPYFADVVEIGKFTPPRNYMGSSKRAYKPGPPDRKDNY